MATFDNTTNLVGITDHVTGKMVKNIIEEYLNEPITEELSDRLMDHLKRTFGEDHPIQVSLDDVTNEIEIVVLDRNKRYIKCSSLTLFPEAYL